MKIAMLIPALVNKGPIIVVHDLCSQYVKRGHECTVFYFDKRVELNFSCRIKRINIWDKIDFSQFDIVHSHMYRPDAYIYIHRLYKQNVILISTLHQHIEQQLKLDDSRNKYLNMLGIHSWFLFLKRFDMIVSLTSFHADYYRRKGLKTCVITNGRYIDFSLDVDNVDMHNIERLKSEYVLLSTVAYVTIRKGLDQILYAMVKDARYALMIIGDGPDLGRLKELSKELGIEHRCLFIGDKLNGYRYLKFADIFLLCSYTEGFPLALIEASAYKLPTVCSDIESITSVMSSEEVVFYHLNDIDSLKRSIDFAFEHKVSLSLNIGHKYDTCFSAEAMAKNYLELYSDLINKKNNES